MNLADKYDITLTGLCSKILDSNTTSYGGALEALEDPLLLLQEMTSKNIGPSTRATRSLLDSTASLSDVEAMALTMSTVARSQRRLKVRRGEEQNDDVGTVQLRHSRLSSQTLPFATSLILKQHSSQAYGKTFVDLRKVKVEDGVELPEDDRSTEVRGGVHAWTTSRGG